MTNETQNPQSIPQSVPMTVLSQYLKDLSLENPNAPGILGALQQTQPQVSVNVTVGFRPLGNPPTPQAPAVYESLITIKAEGTVQNNPGFIVECSYGGAFALPQGLPEHVVRGLMMVEAPRLLFPFARQIASECVMNSGFGPLLIAPVDFMSLYNQQAQAEKLATDDAAGNA